MVRLRPVVLAVLVAGTAAMLHIVAFIEVERSPPELRAYGPNAAAWNGAALALAELAVASWLSARAHHDLRMHKVRPLRHPWVGLPARTVAYFLAAHAALAIWWLPTTLTTEAIQVALSAAATLIGLAAHAHLRTPAVFGMTRTGTA